MLDLSLGCPDFTMGIFADGDFPIVPKIDVQDDSLDQESRIQFYGELFCRAMVERAYSHNATSEQVLPYIKHILSWLAGTDFYTAPASTKYHDACPSGLLTHTLRSYNALVGLRSVPKFKSVVETQWWSAVFAILVHDWCKIGRYESYLKNVKDDKTGEWVQITAYKYKEDGVARFGHSTQSLIMIMQLCNNKYTSLTFEEMAAIRWHMDNWDMTSYDAEDLRRCNDTIPMVRMIQFADQLSITEY